MNTNLFTKELKRNRKNLIIWSSIVVGFTLMVLAIFPAMSGLGDEMTGLMEGMPEELRKAMGMDEQTWSSILGFYSTYFGIYIVVLTGIYTTSTGTTIVSKEERDRTSEFLMTRPISRKEIFTTKMLSLLTLSGVILIIQLVTAIAGILLFSPDPINWATFAIMHVHGTALVLFFTGLGVLISMYLNPKMNFMGMVVGIIFGSYFINAVAKASDQTEWLGYISPFKYADFTITDPGYELNMLNVTVLILLGIGCAMYAFTVFRKKDLAA